MREKGRERKRVREGKGGERERKREFVSLVSKRPLQHLGFIMNGSQD